MRRKFWIGLSWLTLLSVGLGVVIGTTGTKPFEERIYLLSLAILAMLFHIVAEYRIREIKEIK